MTKPLGYYTSYTPGDDGLLAEMQEAWGAQFQLLTNVERTWLIVKIAKNLCADFCRETDNDSVHEGAFIFAWRISNDELSTSDQLGLLSALVEQVKASRHETH